MRYWNLFREMDQLHREVDDVFRNAGYGRLFSGSGETGSGLRHFPRLNLREDADNVYVEALLPGVDPKQIEISMLGRTLTLAGERAIDEVKDRTWHRRERGAGKFMRTVELPVDVDVNKVKAEAKHGLLMVTLPKVAAAKPKKIDIKVR